MNIVFPSDLSRATSYTFNFTYTLRGEPVNLGQLSGDVILDVNGAFYQKGQASDSITIDVIGGIDKYIHAKSSTTPYPFYISQAQKISLYNLMRSAVAGKSTDIQITSNNESLESFITHLYLNFKG